MSKASFYVVELFQSEKALQKGRDTLPAIVAEGVELYQLSVFVEVFLVNAGDAHGLECL